MLYVDGVDGIGGLLQVIGILRNVVRKKRDYVGKIPKGGGGVWPKPTPYFSLCFPIQGRIKWQKKR